MSRKLLFQKLIHFRQNWCVLFFFFLIMLLIFLFVINLSIELKEVLPYCLQMFCFFLLVFIKPTYHLASKGIGPVKFIVHYFDSSVIFDSIFCLNESFSQTRDAQYWILYEVWVQTEHLCILLRNRLKFEIFVNHYGVLSYNISPAKRINFTIFIIRIQNHNINFPVDDKVYLLT